MLSEAEDDAVEDDNESDNDRPRQRRKLNTGKVSTRGIILVRPIFISVASLQHDNGGSSVDYGRGIGI